MKAQIVSYLALVTLLTAALPDDAASASDEVSGLSGGMKIASASDKEKKEGKVRKEVLDPTKMFGEPKIAYMAAKNIPEIAEKLFCYCGCDFTDSHSSLLDCYTSDHGKDCSICTGEILLALRLHTEGKSIAEIQKEVDRSFAPQYPLKDPTPQLKKYRAGLGLKAMPPKDPKVAELAAKPGFQAGSCCGHHHK